MRGIGKGGTRQCLFESERTLTRKNDCALNNVLQLPNVARPIVGLETPCLFLGKARKRTAARRRITGEEMLNEQRNVLRPRTEWRHFNRKHAKAKIQIASKASSRHLFCEI